MRLFDCSWWSSSVRRWHIKMRRNHRSWRIEIFWRRRRHWVRLFLRIHHHRSVKMRWWRRQRWRRHNWWNWMSTRVTIHFALIILSWIWLASLSGLYSLSILKIWRLTWSIFHIFISFLNDFVLAFIYVNKLILKFMLHSCYFILLC